MINFVRRGLIAALIFSACSSTSDPQPVDASDVDAIVTVTLDASASVDANCDPSLTYASFGMNFFATYCNRCHTWDQESAQLNGSVLSDTAGTQTIMPPSVPFPAAAERMQLVQWLGCGAP